MTLSSRAIEADRQRSLLRYFAEQNDKQVLPPAPKKSITRTRFLLANGFLSIAGISSMWGDLYAITPKGRAMLSAHQADEKSEGKNG